MGCLASVSRKMCNSPTVLDVQSVTVDRVVAAWRKELGLDISWAFADTDQIRLLECEKCHLKFFLPDSFSETGTIYSHLEGFHWYYMPSKWEHELGFTSHLLPAKPASSFHCTCQGGAPGPLPYGPISGRLLRNPQKHSLGRKSLLRQGKKMVSSFLRRSGIHVLLKGHTLYAAFCKNGEK
jgi:hypothetical protein